MFKVFSKSYSILRQNLLFIQPVLLLILFVITGLSYIATGNLPQNSSLILLLSLFLSVVTGSAGILYINKLAVKDYDENSTNEEITVKSLQNFKKFFEGVGFGFLKILLSFIFLSLIYFTVILIVSRIVIYFLGIPEFISVFKNPEFFTKTENLLNYFKNIPLKDSVFFMAGNISIMFLNHFALIFFAVLYFDEVNIFKTFWRSVIFFFKTFLINIVIILFMMILYIIMNLISLIAGAGSFAFVLIILLLALYLNYYLILVLCLYDEKTSAHSNNGTDLIG